MAEDRKDDFFDDEDEDLDMSMLFAQLSDLENAEMRLMGQEAPEEKQEESAMDMFNDLFAQMGGFEQMESSAMDEIRTLFDDMPEESSEGEFDESRLKDEEAYNDIMKRLDALNALENFKGWDQFEQEYSDDEEDED